VRHCIDASWSESIAQHKRLRRLVCAHGAQGKELHAYHGHGTQGKVFIPSRALVISTQRRCCDRSRVTGHGHDLGHSRDGHVPV
jgi:hypothetical protein